MYGMRKDDLVLLPHDPEWKNDYFAEMNRISAALKDPSVRIEHVGSTSIPTVYAKPILDVAILCGEQGVDSVVFALQSLDYEFRGQFAQERDHYYAVLDKANKRLCQAHIFPEANAAWYSRLMFRDVLRKNLLLAREYDKIKREFAAIATNKMDYAQMKSRWLDSFMLKVSNAATDAQQGAQPDAYGAG